MLQLACYHYLLTLSFEALLWTSRFRGRRCGAELPHSVEFVEPFASIYRAGPEQVIYNKPNQTVQSTVDDERGKINEAVWNPFG